MRSPKSNRSGQAQRGGSRRDGAQPRDSQSRQARGDPGSRREDPQGRSGVPVGPEQWDQAAARGPFNDENYGPWADRLRDVQEVLPQQDLRDEMARIWDSVRSIRADSKRHGKEPQWDLVQTQVVKPLTEVRERVSERLAQLQSKEAMVPIDRDPVPDRYSELVRTYFENLGQGER